MKSWNELSMAEKADIMKLAIEGGVYDLDAIRSGYNEYAKGGKIHIKPENRGKFTALKKRTGHSATWFKEHGTPAQKKMAVFALNSRHWKHEDGGNLFSGYTQPTQQMHKPSDYRYVLDETGKWNRVANDEMGRVFQELTVTPKNIKYKFIPERIDNSLETAKQRDRFYRYRDENGNVKGEQGLKIVSPEFDVLALAPIGKQIVNTGTKAIKNIIRSRYKSNNSTQPGLVWDAEQMFKDGYNYSYTQEDVNTLNSFIPEYKNIERATKANGTYLRMPDGSTWKGDPREWVIAQSKNVRDNYGDEILTHGNSNVWKDKNGVDVTGEVLGKKTIWTSTNPYLGDTYGSRKYRLVIPKDADIKTVADAEGRFFGEVKSGIDTDMLVYPNLTENNVVRINNVVDRGPINLTNYRDHKPLPQENISDYFRRVFTGDDLVIGENIRRKALLGNNGMFDINNSNIYKGLAPIGLGTSFNYFNSSNE